MGKILAVDDDEAILRVIKRCLEKDGHEVTVCSDAKAVLSMKFYYDIILLDVMMPDIDGFELCKQIRSRADCPILFLTAKTGEESLVNGLGCGGDDYIQKPFGVEELRARVAAHIRRENREKQNYISFGGVDFNMAAGEVWTTDAAGDRIVIPFTKGEYEICRFMALNHDMVFSKDQLLEKVFGFDVESDSASVVEHIKNIRKKLSVCGLNPIQTVWGMGYKWSS